MGNTQPKGQRITVQDKAILDLKIQRDKLHQYQKRILLIIDREVEIAKVAIVKGDKRRALLALKKKRYQEKLLEKSDAHLINLENLTNSIEFALVEKEILSGLKQGNQVLKELQKEMSVESVEKLMEETADAIAYQNEIDELLSSQISAQDEEDILEQLAQIELEQRIGNELPEVPTTEPIKDKDEVLSEEEEKESKEEKVASRKNKQKAQSSRQLEPALLAA
ncbi:uncharacterized protein VTP21DRAFT_3983 [Calcarisporiella thermophila]|uniref:uncharacterized protein n=1 Tax=Calcarisporiella thermophila TaxID=911321 RepID=UPI003742D0C3